MTEQLASAMIYLGASILFVAGIVVLAIGAWWWADAVRSAARARAHSAQADETEATVHQAQTAVDELIDRTDGLPLDNPGRHEFEVPPDRELLEAVLAGRSRNGQRRHDDDFTTTEQNEGIPESPPTGRGGMYRTEEFE